MFAMCEAMDLENIKHTSFGQVLHLVAQLDDEELSDWSHIYTFFCCLCWTEHFHLQKSCPYNKQCALQEFIMATLTVKFSDSLC